MPKYIDTRPAQELTPVTRRQNQRPSGTCFSSFLAQLNSLARALRTATRNDGHLRPAEIICRFAHC